jgi:hypothetical protein
MNELEQLKRENEELRASNNEIRKNLRDACTYLACTVDITKFNTVLNKTQVQSLADVKADALIEAAKSWVVHTESDYGFRSMLITKAEKLRNK